jgi:hypothetical protein
VSYADVYLVNKLIENIFGGHDFFQHTPYQYSIGQKKSAMAKKWFSFSAILAVLYSVAFDV